MSIKAVPNQNCIQKALASTFAASATSCTLSEDISALLSTVSEDNPGVFVVDRVDSNGTATPTKREYCTFTGVSTTTLSGITRNADSSGSDQEHSTGAVVEFVMDALWGQSVVDTFDVEHDADGTHDTTKVVDLTTAQTLTNKTLTSPVINTPTLTATAAALTSPKITTAIADSGGNELIKVTATASAVNEITLANAATGGNPTVTASGGDDNVGIDFKIKGTGTVRKPASVVVQVVDGAVSLSTGDGKAYITIPEELNGTNLVGVHAQTITASSTATSTLIQIRNVTDGQDMLTWPIQIDALENNSASAASIAIINTSYDDVATNDLLAIDIDQTSSTAPKGLIVRLRFALP